MSGPNFAFGLRFLADRHAEYTRAGLAVSLRIKNFDESSFSGARLGFAFAPTGGQSGTTDILIQPPPEVTDYRSTQEGLELKTEFKIEKKFVISHTWVQGRQQQLGYTDPREVFRSKTVVGLVYDQRVYSIDSVLTDSASGEFIRWNIIAYAVERGPTT